MHWSDITISTVLSCVKGHWETKSNDCYFVLAWDSDETCFGMATMCKWIQNHFYSSSVCHASFSSNGNCTLMFFCLEGDKDQLKSEGWIKS